MILFFFFFFFSSRRRHTRCGRDWSSDVCSSDLGDDQAQPPRALSHPCTQCPRLPLALPALGAAVAVVVLGVAGLGVSVGVALGGGAVGLLGPRLGRGGLRVDVALGGGSLLGLELELVLGVLLGDVLVLV